MARQGASARRVPALGKSVLTDADIFKVVMVGKTERGFSGLVQREIYSMNDYYLKCGGFNPSYYGAYTAQSFYDELDNDVNCELKVLSYVDAAATQAVYALNDGAAVKIFDVKAGRKGVADRSAFGNKIAIKTTQLDKITMKLTADVIDSAVEAYLDGVDNLKVGNYVKFTEGATSETRAITAINPATKKITFAAISESAGFSVANCTVTRLDWKLEVFVKDELGNYQKKEVWESPFAKSNTIGLASLVNDLVEGSDFVILDVNAANASLPELQRPVALSTETPLAGGSDGAAPNDANWKTLVDTYLVSEEFMFLFAPESSSITHNQNMLDFCTDSYKGMFYAQAANGALIATLQNLGASLRSSVKFGMIPSDKWITVDDPTLLGGTKQIPKVAIDIAHWYNTFAKFGESKVAAGNKGEMVLRARGKLNDVNGVVHDDRDGVGTRLIENYSVNICKFDLGKGITNNSARTLSTDKGYMYQNQIIQFLLYQKSILIYLREIEQDRSGSRAQETHRNVVWAYLNDKYKNGHLFVGKNEDGTDTTFNDVCIIENDFTINTLTRIAAGEEEMFFQFVAVPPIEKPILSIASAPVTSVKG